jgi:uncharacterized protein YjiS (DUF1127 family)
MNDRSEMGSYDYRPRSLLDRLRLFMLSINRSQVLVYRLRHQCSDRNRFKFGSRVTRRILQIAKFARQRLGCWIDRSAERQRLPDMSERELKDIGITRYDALKEWEKPFWRE